MKKIYMKPKTDVVKLASHKPMLAGSETVGAGGPFSGTSSDIQSRRQGGSVWDDEEE